MDTQTHITLSRLLSRLDAQQVPHTSYERAKTQRNIEHARTLLLTLEKQSATIRIQNQRQDAQADLQRKRESIKGLSARLEAAEAEDSEEDDESEADDVHAQAVSYEPARKDTDSGIDTGQTPAMQAQILSQQAEQAQHRSQQPQSTPTPSELRPRRQQPPLQASDNRSAASTTAREALFSGRSQSQEPSRSNLSKSETMLSHNRTEQENLTTSLLSLASALKQSSQQFGASLETEKETLRRAEGGLDKSAQGMEAAEKKMGALRRMSEGQGWWGRVKLYGFIFALWVFCFLVVFVGPKIRL